MSNKVNPHFSLTDLPIIKMTRYNNKKITGVSAECLKNKNTTNTQLVPYDKKNIYSKTNSYLSTNYSNNSKNDVSTLYSQGDFKKIPPIFDGYGDGYGAYNTRSKNNNNSNPVRVSKMSTAYTKNHTSSNNKTRNQEIYQNPVLQTQSPKITNKKAKISLSNSAADQIFIKDKTKKQADQSNWAKVLPPYRVVESENEVSSGSLYIEEEEEIQINDDQLDHSHLDEIHQVDKNFKNFSDKIKVSSQVIKNMKPASKKKTQINKISISKLVYLRTKNCLTKILNEIDRSTFIYTFLGTLLFILALAFFVIRLTKIERSE